MAKDKEDYYSGKWVPSKREEGQYLRRDAERLSKKGPNSGLIVMSKGAKSKALKRKKGISLERQQSHDKIRTGAIADSFLKHIRNNP